MKELIALILLFHGIINIIGIPFATTNGKPSPILGSLLLLIALADFMAVYYLLAST